MLTWCVFFSVVYIYIYICAEEEILFLKNVKETHETTPAQLSSALHGLRVYMRDDDDGTSLHHFQ